MLTMATGFTLIDRGQAIAQCRTPRRQPWSGVMVTHTAESVMDTVGVDTGPENVDGFIHTRGDYGSYHWLGGRDSDVRLAPPQTYETWHVAADAHNWHATGYSLACGAHQLDPDSPWTQRAIARMGAAIADDWIAGGMIHVARNCRYGTRDEALRRVPNLYHHGVLQPGDRTDMCVVHPRRRELEQLVVSAVRARANGVDPLPPPTPTEEDEIMGAAADIITAVEKCTTNIINVTNRNDSDTRAVEGYCCLLEHDGPRQFVVLPKPGVGWARLHIPGEVKGLLKRQNLIQQGAQSLADPDGDGTAELVDYVQLTAEQTVALMALPEF